MFCSKEKNHKINALHKRALKLIKPDLHDFDKLLNANKMVNIHTRNIQILMGEVFCCINKLNPPLLWNEVIANENNEKSRNGTQLILPRTKKSFGMKSFAFRGSMLWNYLPKQFEECINLPNFKNKIKEWVSSKCQCHLCRN